MSSFRSTGMGLELEVGGYYHNNYGDMLQIKECFDLNNETIFVDHTNKKYYMNGVAVGDNRNWDIVC